MGTKSQRGFGSFFAPIASSVLKIILTLSQSWSLFPPENYFCAKLFSLNFNRLAKSHGFKVQGTAIAHTLGVGKGVFTMKKQSLSILALAIPLMLPPSLSFAQSSVNSAELNQELEKLYKEKQASGTSAPAPQQQIQVQIVEAQKQPVTVIEDSPLSESKADQLRKSRQEAELYTEQTIVEKLEQSRIEDEKRRAEALFGDRLNKKEEAPAQVVAPVALPPVVVPAQPVVVAPAVVEAAPAAEVLTKEDLKSELKMALEEAKAAQPEVIKDKTFVSVMAGTGDYADVANVRSQYAAGFALGREFQNRIQVEGTFGYSKYEVEQIADFFYNPFFPRMTEVSQYNLGVGARYKLLTGMFQPMIGGLMSYTQREYKDTQFTTNRNDYNSTAIDLGLNISTDIMLSEKMSLFLDYKYIKNISSQNRDAYQASFVNVANSNVKPLERLDYTILTLGLKTTF